MEWGALRIGDFGKYLGVFVGPGAVEHSWRAPLAKWQARAAELARHGVPATVLQSLYPPQVGV